MQQGRVRHDSHPRLHLFVRVGAEIVRPHVGMCGLDVGGRGVGTRTEVNLEETEEAGEEREGEGRLERYQPRPHQSDRVFETRL